MSSSSQQRVVVALSGGVDSAVAAALLIDDGMEVIGCYLDFGHELAADAAPAGEAAAVADALGIDLHVLEARDRFAAVLDYFADQYAAGRTPNPCGMCNRICKFALLAELADALEAAHIATGHHVVKLDQGPRGLLARSPQIQKDQTYALFNVPAEILRRCLFPVSRLGDKAAVRARADALGLAVADKPDSQDMCFAPDGDYEAILRRRAPQALTPGDIIDAEGRVLGRHRGVGLYTIGQRRGLGVATGEPAYVTEIDPRANTVRLGAREQASGTFLHASQANWHARMPPGDYRLAVQVRYAQRAVAATVRVGDESRFDVHFDRPVHAITPGQAAVVYDGNVLLGGGWID